MAKKTPKPTTIDTVKRQKTSPPRKTKRETCIALLKRPKGASLTDLQKATGWQAHSVRGFLSGTIRKLEGVRLISEIKSGSRCYRIEAGKAS
jgi:hypothetical protein